MDRPLEIAFHNCSPSPSVEAEIRKHVERLEARYTHLTGCRVSVERLHKQHQTGNVFEVHVTLNVPGQDLAVSHKPHKASERFAHPDIQTSIRDAFRAAERQLESYKRQQRLHPATPAAEG